MAPNDPKEDEDKKARRPDRAVYVPRIKRQIMAAALSKSTMRTICFREVNSSDKLP